MHYLDTSVLAAAYCPEERSARVQGLLPGLGGLTISPLTEVEFHGAIARKVRTGELARADAVRIFGEFHRHLAEPRFRSVPIHESHYRQAREWIAGLSASLRVLDAVHLAVAAAHGLTLVTADTDFVRCAEHFGVLHRLVR